VEHDVLFENGLVIHILVGEIPALASSCGVDLDSATQKKWRFQLSTYAASPCHDRCEASVEAVATNEPYGTLYCTLLLLLPSRCIHVRFACANGRATPARVLPYVPHPGHNMLLAMALHRDSAEWQDARLAELPSHYNAWFLN
jgi:hypothetical protein